MLSVGRVMEQSAMTYASAPKASEQVSQTKDTTLAADATDKFVQSGAGFTPAYTKAAVTDNRSGASGSSTSPNTNIPPEKVQRDTAEKVTQDDGQKVVEQKNKSLTQTKNELMRDMVMKTLTGQAEDSRKTGAMKELEEIIRSYSDDDEDEAADENYWSADSTANRILDFAKELAGDDEEKLNTLRDAFETAFSDSEKSFGKYGGLPEVSYETYDKVKQGFDDLYKQLTEKKAETSPDTPAKTEAERV